MNLRDYLHFQRMTIQEFADKVGYTRTHLSMIVNDKMNPSARLAKDIERLTNGEVEASQWIKKKKKTKK